MLKQQTEYWFKRRRYGYGWTPVTAKGWLLVAFILIVAFGGAAVLFIIPKDLLLLVLYLSSVLLLGILAVLVGYRHGPSPKWRWGKKPGDNPDLDF